MSGSSTGSSDDGPWRVEPVPDPHRLFMRVHRQDIEGDGRPMPRAFRNRPNPLDTDAPKAMSTDWCKYATPEQTHARGRSDAQKDNGVVALMVSGVRSLYQQEVVHSPWYRDPEVSENPNNRAHTDVTGPKSAKEASGPDERVEVLGVRSGFVELSKWEIEPSAP